jgi:hypothetical protein
MEGPYESGDKGGAAPLDRSAVNGDLAKAFQEGHEFFSRQSFKFCGFLNHLKFLTINRRGKVRLIRGRSTRFVSTFIASIQRTARAVR